MACTDLTPVFTALAVFNKGLEHVNTMEGASSSETVPTTSSSL